MDWKETVMAEDDLYRKIFCNIPQIKPGDDLIPLGVKVAKAQAEISFKAGIKEVVEWVEGNRGRLNALDDSTRYRAWQDWQAKLKEWGVK